jgi:NTE family protein
MRSIRIIRFRTIGYLLVLAVGAMPAGCARYRANPPLDSWDHTRPLLSMGRSSKTDSALILLAFSGGGTRAAALSYGVLEELRDTHVEVDGQNLRMVDQVDVISGVSGGSFTAAYYGLFGDRTFEDFESRVLRRNLQRDLWRRLLNPYNLLRLASPHFNRSDLAAEYYDSKIFDRKAIGNFADLAGPAILINATDFVRGSRFAFIREYFDPICSDLLEYPVSRAVAASSSVPGPFPPLKLRNHAGTCGYKEPLWIAQTLETDTSHGRRYIEARLAASYLDRTEGNDIYLVDGGLTDNLGIRGTFDRVIKDGGISEMLDTAGREEVNQILIILVNAQTEPDLDFDRGSFFQSLALMAGVSAGIQIRRFNYETIELVRNSFQQWAELRSHRGHPIDFRMVEISFSQIRDGETRRYFNNLPTSLALPESAVLRLREAGRNLLRESTDFQEAVKILQSGRVRASELRRNSAD